MTHKALKHDFNRFHKNKERRISPKELAGFSVLLAGCMKKKTDELGFVKGEHHLKIIDHEDGTQTVEGLKEMQKPLGCTDFKLGIEDVALVAVLLLALRFSKTGFPKDRKNRDS